MKTVKITIPDNVPPIKRQTPNSSLIWGDFLFVLNGDIPEADYWVVLDELNAQSVTCKCAPENVFMVTGESPYIKWYSRPFSRQFAKVFTCQRNLLLRRNTVKHIPLLPWFAGAKQLDEMRLWDTENYLDYDYFLNDSPVKEFDRIAIVTSNKRMSKGHCQRLDFIERLQKEFPDKIDLYGNGFNPIGDKYPIISKYKYQLVIENCSCPSYITEKIMDAYLCECYPLYIGAPDIGTYFDNKSFTHLDIKNVDDAIRKIRLIFENDVYNDHISEIKSSKKLVLDKYNIFPCIVDIINQYGVNDAKKETITLTNKHDLEWKVSMKLVSLIDKYL